MCVQIQIDGGPYIETTGDLFRLIGDGNVIFHPGGETISTEECLCHVNAEKTARKAGYSCKSGWDKAGCDYLWKKHST